MNKQKIVKASTSKSKSSSVVYMNHYYAFPELANRPRASPASRRRPDFGVE